MTGNGNHVVIASAQGQDEKLIRLTARFLAVHAFDGQLLIAHGRGLVKLDARGEIVWSNDDLAKDGVEIRVVVGDAVLGRGDWDPPGGWRTFAVSLATGDTIEWTGP